MCDEVDAELFTPVDWSLPKSRRTSLLPTRPVTPTRRCHLSRSPLDNLQVEFRRYKLPEQFTSLQFAHLRDSSRDQTPQGLQRIDEFTMSKDSGDTPAYSNDIGHADPSSAVPDWSFVQRRLEDKDCVQNSDCPSMTTGSTINSRNSSTRSARSIRPGGVEQPDTAVCPIAQCGRIFRDLPTHMLTHQTERPEKCPIQTCEYHTKGFAWAYERDRHTLIHFNGTFQCGFCPLKSTKTAFGRCDIFLRHLVSVHSVEQMPLSQREEFYRAGTIKHPRRPLEGQVVATCELCSEPFDAQGFYEHLQGCVFRQVTRCRIPLGVGEWAQESCAKWHSEASELNPRNDSVNSPVAEYLVIPTSVPDERQNSIAKVPNLRYTWSPTPTTTKKQNSSIDHKDIAELTASSRCLSLTSSHDGGVKSSDEETDWTEDAGSPFSEPDANSIQPLISPVKQQLVDAAMVEFYHVFDKMLRTHGGGSNTTGGYTGSSNSSTYSSWSFVSRKRSLSGGSTPPPNENGDDPHKRRRPDSKATSGKQHTSELRFACPYYKRNPGRHQTFTSCRDPGFITVARLK
jgi:hypothetical protein